MGQPQQEAVHWRTAFVPAVAETAGIHSQAGGLTLRDATSLEALIIGRVVDGFAFAGGAMADVIFTARDELSRAIGQAVIAARTTAEVIHGEENTALAIRDYEPHFPMVDISWYCAIEELPATRSDRLGDAANSGYRADIQVENPDGHAMVTCIGV